MNKLKFPPPPHPTSAPPNPVSTSDSIVLLFSKMLILFAVAAGAAQIFIESTTANLVCTGIAIVGTVLLSFGILRPHIVQQYAVSAFSVFAAFLTMLWGPLIFTSLEGRPITFELQLPYQTFIWAFIICFGLTLAHMVYRHSRVLRSGSNLLSKIWESGGFFDKPNPLVFWAMGLVGFASVYYINVYRQEDIYSGEAGGAGIKFLGGFVPFAFAPFVLLALPYVQTTKARISPFLILGCIGYLALLLLVAILSNVRSFFAIPLLSTGLAFVLLGFIGKLRLAGHRRLLFVVCIPIGIFAVSQLSDLALAMRVARSSRGSVSAQAMLKETMSVFGNKKLLAEHAQELTSVNLWSSKDWDENYVSSVFLSRFVVTKFIDNTLSLRLRMREAEVGELRSFTWARILATFPEPIYNRLPVAYPKLYVTAFSVGDYMFYLGTGNLMSGYKAGSFIGNGVAVMGYGFPFFVVALAFPVFMAFDSLYRFDLLIFGRNLTRAGPARGRAAIVLLALSPLVVIAIFDFFNFWTNESVSGMISSLLRGFPQKMLFYWVFMKVGGMFKYAS